MIGAARTFASWFLAVLLLSLPAVLLLGSVAAAASPPVNIEPPSISGVLKSKEILSASPGSWSDEPTAYTYRWERCAQDGSTCVLAAEGETASSYPVKPGDVGLRVRVLVTAQNPAGPSTPAASSLSGVIQTAWEYVDAPPRVERVHWSLGRGPTTVPDRRSLGVGITSGYCVGEPPPAFDHAKIIERPKTARYPFGSAVVTAFLRFPDPLEVAGSINRGEPVPACLGIGSDFLHYVRLKRPVARLALFDGSFSPPRRVRR